MGLSLNNLFQRPYIKQENNAPLRKKEQEEKSSATQANRQEAQNQNSRSNGLNYVDQNKTQYTPQYEQRFSMPPVVNAYSGVNINSTRQQAPVNAVETQSSNIPKIDNNINIAQILKDFRNTALAIGTPEDLSAIVNDYLVIVEKQAATGKANKNLVKSTLDNAAVVLDNYISETLNKESKVVENWVDALFLQNVDLNYDENNINERFAVQFPEDTQETSRAEEVETASGQNILTSEIQENSNIIPINVMGDTSVSKIPQDKELKSLFIQAKKYAYAKKPEEAIRTFEQALNRALDIDDTETSGKIYYEVGKIYDDYNYVAQALKSYNQSLKLTTDENVKTKSHYAMAQIYNDVNQITPAIDHYFSTVSHAGEADNLPAQSTSLTKLGNIYTDMYDKEAFTYYDVAQDLANETDNNKLKGYVSSNTGKAYVRFEEPEKALKSYSNAVKNYTDADSPQKAAQNYLAAADIMVEFNKLNKARTLLVKAQKQARQTEDVNLMNEINSRLQSLEAMVG